ncbi:hypothetical protein Tco_0805367 [Tanacetum coccineum]
MQESTSIDTPDVLTLKNGRKGSVRSRRTRVWQELADRVSERELELLSGSLVVSNCVDFLKKLQQRDQLKLMELVKLIAAMHI